MENVPQVCGSENLPAWQSWLSSLESMGYRNYFRTINAMEHGIPQRRKRCFMVSILGDYGFTFPAKRALQKTLSDFLEKDPPAKYDLSDAYLRYVLYGPDMRKQQFLCSYNATQKGERPTLCTRTDRPAGCAFPTRIKVVDATQKGYAEAEEGDGIAVRTRKGGRGTVAHQSSPTIMTAPNVATIKDARIRRLTPLECMRLMGFGDEDYKAMRAIGMSDRAIVHCAGDSIVVDVLEDIFKEVLQSWN